MFTFCHREGVKNKKSFSLSEKLLSFRKAEKLLFFRKAKKLLLSFRKAFSK